MDINYHINCKRHYEDIILNLRAIIAEIEQMCSNLISHIEQHTNQISSANDAAIQTSDISMSSGVDEFKDLFCKNVVDLNSIVERIHYFQDLKSKHEAKIFELCDHNMVDDYVDVTPDDSKEIYYCDKCGWTPVNN